MQTTPDEWNRQIATNVSAPWHITRAVLASAQPDALRIVFMTSAAAWGFAPGAGPYNVTKAALNSLAGSFAAECVACLPERDIQINALDPGQVRSEMNAASAVSPFTTVNVALLLLSHVRGGPTGRFFRADGTSVAFGNTPPYGGDLLDDRI
jgi:3-oxoacyl-[acyl-carrier protein] reductase